VATGPIARVEKSCAPCTADEANELMSLAAANLSKGDGSKVPVRVTSEPPGAVIEVDGVAGGVAPVELQVLPGDHVFRAKLAGRADAVVTVTVAAQPGGDAQVVAMSLVPGGEASGARDIDAAPGRFHTWKWVAAGGGALALVSGIWLLAVDGNGLDCPPGPGACPQTRETTAGGLVLTLGGAALGGVATWMWLEDRKGAPARGVGLAPSPTGMTLFGWF
jgi:hypothetical protein